ncbi:RNA exonuclease 1 homolog [Megalops cyprinoides]|uniref:RNA exonuclease 1 homolog n=1 Tax=Megalops cyprinoides TaxID=118141 RepID=UPI001863AC40|nr:RNA exonuclease 1 homolog [Megalops cyprinoides]
MLPSAGFFEKIDCPFFRRGFCERPFCHYKHVKDKKGLATSHRSPSTRAHGNGNNYLTHGRALLQNTDMSFVKDRCLLELERINKEIETVKCEVEKEQRRLSRYKSFQGDGNSTGKVLIPSSEIVDKDRNHKDRNHNSYNWSTPHTQKSRSSKYVVDNSRPRTDLEYDPLSNYSADLHSGSSADCKPHVSGESEDKRGLKRTREKVKEDNSELLTLKLEDSDDEGVLVIDIPPMEDDRKKSRPRKLCKITTQALPEVQNNVMSFTSVPDVSFPVQSCEQEISTPVIINVQSGQDCANTSPGGTVTQGNECKQNNIGNVFEDITKCLENLRKESEKMTCLPKTEPLQGNKDGLASGCFTINCPSRSFSDSPVKQNAGSIKVEHPLTKCEFVPSSDEKGTNFQPKQFSGEQLYVLDLKKSVSCALSSSLKAKPKDQDNGQREISVVDSYWLPEQQVSAPCVEQMAMQILGQDFTEGHSVLSSNRKHNEKPVAITDLLSVQLLEGPSTSGVPQPVTNGMELLSVSQVPNMPEMSKEVAKTDLSSGEELDYSDMDLSDSDPMEECYRIFMEANEAESELTDNPGSKPVAAVDVERLEVDKKPLPLSGPKRRVAHVSKHNEQQNKSRQQIIVPLRRPASHLSNPSRIQQLQQKATSLTTAVKGGQAFVAATTGQRRPVTLAPAPQPSPVQTTSLACVNIIPVGAAIQLGTNVHFIIPEGSIAVPVTPVSSPVAPSQQATLTAAKPNTTKRKPRPRPESSTKVPHDIRQRYVNLFVEEFLKTSFTVQDAFEKALAEEKTVYDRSSNKLRYLSVAVNALKKLKNQNTPSTKDPGLAALYGYLKEHVLSEAELKENNYPICHPDKASSALLFGEVKKGSTDPLKRICCRCGATFAVSQSGRHVRKEECNYHYGKMVENKVPGGVESHYSCCEGAIGTLGCQVFKLHVHDAVDLEGFVTSLPKPLPDNDCPGVFALDCEMCYTTQGLELARVTVVNTSLQVIYDTFVKPDNEVIDYNTRFSGVSEDDLKGCSFSIRDVQEVLLSFVSADTILIGHGLEKDLCALKLLHGTVVDTSVVFPHRLGLPHKRSLRSLTADYLRRIIQESVEGRDSREDAAACMELMLWKVKEDSKVKRW